MHRSTLVDSEIYARKLGYKLKRIVLPNPPSILTTDEQSPSLTSFQSKRFSPHPVFPKLVRTITLLSNTRHSRLNSTNGNSPSPPSRDMQSYYSTRVDQKSPKKRQNVKALNLLTHADKTEDSTDNLMVTTIRLEPKNKWPLSPKAADSDATSTANVLSKCQESLRNKTTTPRFDSINETPAPPTSHAIRRLPVQDQWFCHLPNAIHTYKPKMSENKPQNFLSQNFDRKTPTKSQTRFENNISLKYNLFNNSLYTQKALDQVITTREEEKSNIKYLKVRSGVVANWGDPKELELTEESERESLKTPEKTEKFRSKSQLKIPTTRRDNASVQPHCHAICQRPMRIRDKEHGHELSPVSDYNWLDRHNAAMARRSRNKSKTKSKEKLPIGDTDIFTSFTGRLSNNSSFNSKKSSRIDQDFMHKNGFDEVIDRSAPQNFFGSDSYIRMRKSGLKIKIEEQEQTDKKQHKSPNRRL